MYEYVYHVHRLMNIYSTECLKIWFKVLSQFTGGQM